MGLADHFFQCGLPRNVALRKLWEQSTEQREREPEFTERDVVMRILEGERIAGSISRVYDPQFLCRYPDKGPDSGDAINKHTPMFCFPRGLTFIYSEDEDPGARFHSFLMTDITGKRSYGFVVTFYDVASRLHVQEILETLVECGAALAGEVLAGEDRVHRDRARALVERRIRPDRVFVPRAVGMLSQWCWNDLLVSWLLELTRMFRESKDPVAPIERYVVNIMNEIPLPPSGNVETIIPIGRRRLHFSFPRPEEAQRLNNFSLYPLFCSLDVQNIVMALELVLLERKILFISKNVALLSSCIYALHYLMYPFTWHHILVPVLPKNLLAHIEAPVPFIFGIESQYFRMDVVNDISQFPDLCIVNLDANKVAVRGPHTSLPSRHRRRLKQNILAAIPPFLWYEHGRSQKMYGAPKSFYRISDISTFYSKAHSSLYDIRKWESAPERATDNSLTKHIETQKFPHLPDTVSTFQRNSLTENRGTPGAKPLLSSFSPESTIAWAASSPQQPSFRHSFVSQERADTCLHTPVSPDSSITHPLSLTESRRPPRSDPPLGAFNRASASAPLPADNVQDVPPTPKSCEGHELVALPLQEVCSCGERADTNRNSFPLSLDADCSSASNGSESKKRTSLYTQNIQHLDNLHTGANRAFSSRAYASQTFRRRNSHSSEASMERSLCYLCSRPYIGKACRICQAPIQAAPDISRRSADLELAPIYAAYHCIRCRNNFHNKCTKVLDNFPCPKAFNEKAIQGAVLKTFSEILKDYKSYMIFPDRVPRRLGVSVHDLLTLDNVFKKKQFEESFDKESRPFVKHFIRTQAFAFFILLRVQNYPYTECSAFLERTTKQQTQYAAGKHHGYAGTNCDPTASPPCVDALRGFKRICALEVNRDGLDKNRALVDPEIGMPDSLDESLLSEPRSIYNYVIERDLEMLMNDGVARDMGSVRITAMNWMKSKLYTTVKLRSLRRNNISTLRPRKLSNAVQKLKAVEAILSEYNASAIETFSEEELRSALDVLKRQNEVLQCLADSEAQVIDEDEGEFKAVLSRLFQAIMACEDRLSADEYQ